MAKPWIHAQSSARKYGGKPENYLPIHQYLDRSKGVVADNRHRTLTHNAWFLFVLEDVFGHNITNSDRREVSVRLIGEDHIIEDLGFIPTAQDYIEGMPIRMWHNGKGKATGDLPSSQKLLNLKTKTRETTIEDLLK